MKKLTLEKMLNILESHKKLLNEEIYKKKSRKAWEKLKISEIKNMKLKN